MNTLKKLVAITSLGALLSAGGAPVLAAESVLVPPRPLELAAPDFSRPDREALVRVRYTVKADGSTADVEAVEGFSNSLFDQAAVSTVEGWRFEPATLNGEAIDLLNQDHVLVFRPTGVSAISPQVIRAYEGIAALLEDDDYQAALEQVQDLMAENIATVFDYAFLNDVLASVYIGLEQNTLALAAVRRATQQISALDGGAPTDLLTPELLDVSLRKRFALAASLNQTVDAVATYERLQALGLPAGDRIGEQAAALQARLDASEPLGLITGIDAGVWRYTPSRRIVAVTEVSTGAIDSLNIRCQRRTLQLAFEAGVEWNLPPVLGECEFEFLGEPGTQFTLYEFAE